MESKKCAFCKKKFFKHDLPNYLWLRRKYCSRLCVYAGSRKPGIPCRICGTSTSSHDKDKIGLLHCGRQDCKEASRKLKNKNISKALSELIQNGNEIGTRWTNNGKSYSVSPEEDALWSVLEKYGFQRQVSFPTHRAKPTHFMMDFAHTARKLYVEVDGPSHRPIVNQLKDAKRDLELAEAGWLGIRIPSTQIKQNLKIIIRRIKRFVGDPTKIRR